MEIIKIVQDGIELDVIGSVDASSITQDADNRFVTDAEKTTWNNKVDKVSGKQLSTNDYTTVEKNKLAGIQAGAQVNAVTSVNGQTGAVTIGWPNLLVNTPNLIEYDMLETDYFKEYTTNVKLEPDTEYTLSFVAKKLSQDSVPIELRLGGANKINTPYKNDYLPKFIKEVNFSQKNSYRFKFTKDGMTSTTQGYTPYLVLRFRNDLKATKIQISQLKLEQLATATTNGLMSSADKTKLDGVEAGAEANTVTSVNGQTGAVTTPNTTYNAATTTTNGLMLSTDKVKLDSIYKMVYLTEVEYEMLETKDPNTLYIRGE